MCRFKSGIILKDKVVVAPGENNSHEALLDSLGMEDSYINATKMFVRAELIPKDNEWWINPNEYPEKWEFIVEQDITPDWFDEENYEDMFRRSICEWWNNHVLVEQEIEELNEGYYRLKECKVNRQIGRAHV